MIAASPPKSTWSRGFPEKKRLLGTNGGYFTRLSITEASSMIQNDVERSHNNP
jgi:hypothetical protein